MVKTYSLLNANPAIEKCLFVVDRKDLDRQTREEFNRFQEGCVEENTNTGTLVRRMLSDDAADKVIVCTIQKLGLALDGGSTRNQSREKRGLATHAEQLERSEEHTSELQSLMRISYAVFCLKKKINNRTNTENT